MTSDKNPQPAIGRAKTVIVDHEIGIVSEIIARTVAGEQASRLDFRGPAKFKADTKQHIKSIILPIIDKIMDSLGVSKKNFEISAVNLGATASADIGVEITGFSADLSLLFALLSASLKIPLRQDILCTGHVASIDGDIASVRGIPIKIEAALTTPGISAFVLPDLDTDGSLQKQTPFKYQAAKESLLRHKGDIKIHSIVDIHDAARIFMTDEAIVLGSLEAGFFYVKSTDRDSESPIDRTVSLIFEENDKRFWDVLEQFFLSRNIQKAKQFLNIFISHHNKIQVYPEKLGEQLFRLLVSIPSSIRKTDTLFPLLPMELYIELTQYAQKGDHEDVRKLHKVIFGEGLGRVPLQMGSQKGVAQPSELKTEFFERFLSEINKEKVYQKVGKSLDEARSCYIMDYVVVEDGFEFNEAITSFYAHLLRHTSSPEGHMNKDAVFSDAIDRVEKAFKNEGGYNAALSEGIRGVRGGLRFVFDIMTDHLKQEKAEKIIKGAFKDAIDPEDFDAKVRLMELFIERIGLDLPSDLRDLSPKKLALHWDEIIRCYSESIEKVKDLIKRL